MDSGAFRLGLGGLVLTVALTSNLVISTEIPEYYRAHEHFPSKNQVCTEENAGPRAGIYCYGRILEAVMAMRLYNDSKTFVDKPLLFLPEEVIERFEQNFPTDDDIKKDALQEFIDSNFGSEGTELEECELTDWTERPEKLSEIKDPKLKDFAFSLNGIWRRLCRQIKTEISSHEDLYSLIYVPNKFIVPGGRFREFYYWDSYWIIKGLLASGMHETTRNILSNFAYIVNKYGFIPNGGRIYYLARSQPPILTGMFYEYFEATGDFKFVQDNLATLEKEVEFWDKRRNVSVNIDSKIYKMYQYRAESDVPRPESYREDVELVKDKPWEEKANIWRNLASAAEAGYDFSSRWFQNYTELSSIDTTNIVEVDLNAFMCWNLEILSYFYSLLPGGEEKEEMYRDRHVEFKRNFQKVFYVDNESGWYDYNLREEKNNIEFYPSNAVPIFARCYDSLDQLKAEKVYERMRKFGAFDFNSGIPTSMHKNTGQQWDLPNSWPPLEHMIIDGFRRSESPKLQEFAYDIAKVWLRVNYNAFNRTGVMWEKYDVEGQVGSGGEYIVQAGFGWTNGVILDLLISYSNRMDFNEIQATDNSMPITNTETLTRAKRFARKFNNFN